MTPEQHEAQMELQMAVEKHARAFRLPEDMGRMEVVTDWVLVVATTQVEGEGDRLYSYNMGFSGGEMPDHIAMGLVEKARTMLGGDEFR